MKKELVEISVKGLMPVHGGVAVFLGPEEKTFLIHVDEATGKAMHYAMTGKRFPRPVTHELVGAIFAGFGISVERLVINNRDEDAFYARLVLRMANEVDTKLVEIDARPSDGIVLALQAHRPMYVARHVLDEAEDMTDLLTRIREGGAQE
jgi:bifunctional DNase/RNase